MGKGRTFYKCACGGSICEDWDWYGMTVECDKCDNPQVDDDSVVNCEIIFEKSHLLKDSDDELF